jgi:hypothetical protein
MGPHAHVGPHPKPHSLTRHEGQQQGDVQSRSFALLVTDTPRRRMTVCQGSHEPRHGDASPNPIIISGATDLQEGKVRLIVDLLIDDVTAVRQLPRLPPQHETYAGTSCISKPLRQFNGNAATLVDQGNQ